MYYIFDKEQIKLGKLYCLGVYSCVNFDETDEEQTLAEHLGVDENKVIIYEGDSFPIHWYYNSETDKFMLKTKYIAYQLGEYVLAEGEYIDEQEVKYKERPNDGIEYKWNFGTKEWEQYTREYTKQEYFNKIDLYKNIVLENGFIFNGHVQKYRPKDVADIATAKDNCLLYKQKKGEELKLTWTFSDNDFAILSLEEFEELQLQGGLFKNKVLEVERAFKAKEPYDVSLEEFKKALK